MKILQWLEDHLMEPLGRIAQNIYLQSIRDAFVIFALPVILTGALFLIIANPPTTINWGIISAWENARSIRAEILFRLICFWYFVFDGCVWHRLQFGRTKRH